MDGVAHRENEHRSDEDEAQELRKYAKEVLIILIEDCREQGLKPPAAGFVLSTMVAMFYKTFARPGRTREQLLDIISDHLKLEGIE